MDNLLGPVLGFIIGFLIVIFGEKAIRYRTWLYQKFAKYQDAIKTLNLRLEAKPYFVGILGFVILLFGIVGVFVNLKG